MHETYIIDTTTEHFFPSISLLGVYGIWVIDRLIFSSSLLIYILILRERSELELKISKLRESEEEVLQLKQQNEELKVLLGNIYYFL